MFAMVGKSGTEIVKLFRSIGSFKKGNEYY